MEDHNGIFCDEESSGDLWVAPDDGVIHKEAQPTVKARYRTALGARYSTETFWGDLGAGVGSLELTQPGSVTFENDSCHDYVARIDFAMGAAVFSLGNETFAYIGCHNEVELDGDSVTDTTPYAGMGPGASSLGALTLLTVTYPPTIWPVYVDVDAGQTLVATLTGMGSMDTWGGGEAEYVKADFGWNLQLLAWPKGTD